MLFTLHLQQETVGNQEQATSWRHELKEHKRCQDGGPLPEWGCVEPAAFTLVLTVTGALEDPPPLCVPLLAGVLEGSGVGLCIMSGAQILSVALIMLDTSIIRLPIYGRVLIGRILNVGSSSACVTGDCNLPVFDAWMQRRAPEPLHTTALQQEVDLGMGIPCSRRVGVGRLSASSCRLGCRVRSCRLSTPS